MDSPAVEMEKAVDVLQAGGILLAPTDTVWGMMCDFKNADTLASIFKIKKSEPKPTAILCDSLERLDMLQLELSPSIEKLMQTFWPGPLTIILSSRLADISHIAGDKNSLGIRLPDAADLRSLIRLFGRPVAATSANLSGEPAPQSLDKVPDEIIANVDYICRFKDEPSGEASTVIDCTGEKIHVIREGLIRLEDLAGTVDSNARQSRF